MEVVSTPWYIAERRIRLLTGEEGVDAWAGEVVGLVRLADVGDVVHLEVHDSCADEARDEGADDLCPEGVAGWDLDVVGHLEVVAEAKCVGAGDISGGSVSFNAEVLSSAVVLTRKT